MTRSQPPPHVVESAREQAGREWREGKRTRLLINVDLIPRTWRLAQQPDGSEDTGATYESKCHPFLEIGYLPNDEFAALERDSVLNGDGWMTERKGGR